MDNVNKSRGKVLGKAISIITVVFTITGMTIDVFDLSDRFSGKKTNNENETVAMTDYFYDESTVNVQDMVETIVNNQGQEVEKETYKQEETIKQEETTKLVETTKQEETTDKKVDKEYTGNEIYEFKYIDKYQGRMYSICATNDGECYYICYYDNKYVLFTTKGKRLELGEIADKLSVSASTMRLSYNPYDDCVYLWAGKYLLNVDSQLNVDVKCKFDKADGGSGFAFHFTYLDKDRVVTNYFGASIVNISERTVEKIVNCPKTCSKKYSYSNDVYAVNGEICVLENLHTNVIFYCDEIGNEKSVVYLKYNNGLITEEIKGTDIKQTSIGKDGIYYFVKGELFYYDGVGDEIIKIGTYVESFDRTNSNYESNYIYFDGGFITYYNGGIYISEY